MQTVLTYVAKRAYFDLCALFTLSLTLTLTDANLKRAPLDTIARLPVDLVPEHIRQYVPTLTSVAGNPQPGP